MRDLYAVYGSLRKGYWNHNWALGDAEYVSTTTVKGYRLGDNGCFPAAIECRDRSVTVEVYDVTNVDTDIIDQMDGMEFNCGYTRRLVWADDGNQVWMYVMPDVLADRFDIDIPTGDWTDKETSDDL